MLERFNQISWDMDVSILNNMYIMGEFFKALGISVLCVCLILFLVLLPDMRIRGTLPFASSNGRAAMYAVTVILTAFTLVKLLIIIYYGNKYYVTYRFDDKGLKVLARNEQKRKNNLMNFFLVLAGTLSGRPGTEGVGFISRGTWDMFMAWEKVRKMKFIDKKHTVILMADYGVKTILFCTPENYGMIKEALQERLGWDS